MNKWRLISFVRRSSQRMKVLNALSSPSTPSDIARKTNMYLTHVSRALKELREVGLVECLTPEERIARYYRRTPLGEEILKEINKNE